MGMFSKPKTPDYAKVQEEARLKEEARIADEEAKSKQSQQESMAGAESKRKAFYQGLVTNTGTEEENKRYLKAV